MITSPKGKEMLRYISPIYQKSKIEQAIYEAIGSEFDSAEELAEEVLLQLHPQTATWGISFWEQRLKLSVNENEDIERRRRKVIARLQSKASTITPKRMGMILSNFTGADINIVENVAPYTFQVNLTGKDGFPKSLEDLYKEVKRIKPSHLSVKYKLVSITQSNLYVGACCNSGETITVYPWTPKQIETRGKVHIALGTNTGVETVTLYPKKEMM